MGKPDSNFLFRWPPSFDYSLLTPLLSVWQYIHNAGRKEGKMEDEIKVIARMDRKKKIRLYHVLLDEGRTFSAWLRDQIDAYLAKKEPNGKRRKEKGREG
jgi:hypothetical protein